MNRSASSPDIYSIERTSLVTPCRTNRDFSFTTRHQKPQIHIHLVELVASKFTKIRSKPRSFYKLEFSEVKNNLKVINDINSIKLLGPHSIRHLKGLGLEEILRLLVRQEDLIPKPPSDSLGAFYIELVINQLLKCIQSCKTQADVFKWCRRGEFSIDLKKDLKFLIIKEALNMFKHS